jgi:DNA processing protein
MEKLTGRRLSGPWKPGEAVLEAEGDLKRCEAEGIRVLTYWSRHYPPQLREIYDPPFLLFSRGTLPAWDVPAVGVVGTRFPTGEGRKEAFRIGFLLGQQGIPVVSGLARGIDAAAHRGNRLGGGHTVAVMAGGLEQIYPWENRGEGRSILESGGCFLGEYPPGTPPLKFHFPARNRIISGLSRWVVIVEAPKKSGALITGDFALEQGRELMVHPLCLESPAGEGGRNYLREGATPWDGEAFGKKEKAPPVSGDKIQDGPDTGSFLAQLLEEELSGRAVKFQGELFRRCRAS